MCLLNLHVYPLFRDPRRIQIWRNVASNIQKLIQICKTLRGKAIIQLFLRYMPLLIKQFLNTGMPILEHNLKYQTDDVISILKIMQSKKFSFCNIHTHTHKVPWSYKFYIMMEFINSFTYIYLYIKLDKINWYSRHTIYIRIFNILF